MNTDLVLFCNLFITIFIFIVIHLLVNYFLASSVQSSQKIYIKTAFIFDCILIIFLFYKSNSFTLFIYLLFCFLLAQYSYFHILNMALTARRINIICFIHTHDNCELKDILSLYENNLMVELRISRLLSLKWIKSNRNGDLVINSKIPLLIAKFFYKLRIIMFNNSG